MRKLIYILAYLPSAIFPLASFVIGLRNSPIFDAPSLLKISPIPALVFFLTFSIVLIFSSRSLLLQENYQGLILFFLFTSGYFLIATILNKPDINTNNIYFAADSGSWYLRMAAEDGWNIGTRAVHPLTPIIFRPLIAVISIFTEGDRFHANLIMLALAGGACVFLMWKITLLISKNEVYAVLCASLLGLSASHLIFASVIESYIFSTICLLCFIWLLIRNKSIYLLIIAGILTIGITITNIVPQVIASLFVQRSLKRTLFFISGVLLISIGLNLITRFMYPVTEYFFIPENLREEQRFSQEVNVKRVGQMAENLLIYNIAAPQPYISIRNEMPRINFLNGTIQNYIWFGWPTLILWIGMLLLSLFRFFLPSQLTSNDKFLAISIFSCLLFNFILHMSYGSEPFLYSADWTYALILFVAINLKYLAVRTWLIFTFLLFVMAILMNNLWFLYLIARRVGEFLV